MKLSKNIIGSLIISGSVMTTPLILNKAINEEIFNVKRLTENILTGGKNGNQEKLISIYNPINPNGIKTDDGYIYIV